MKDKKAILNKVKDYPIWKLISLVNYTNRRIIELKKSGESSTDTLVSKLRYKRNVILDKLTDDLNLWKKDKSNSKYDIGGFADANNINFDEMKINGDF